MAALPPDFDTRLRDLHGRGLGRNEIAQLLSVSTGTVTAHAKKLGLAFDRRATAAAVAAHQVDLRVRRAAIIDRLYARAEKNLTRLEAPTYTFPVILSHGADSGTYTDEHDVEQAPSADERNHQTAIAGYLSTAAKLEQIDGAPGITKTASIITRVAEAFGISDA